MLLPFTAHELHSSPAFPSGLPSKRAIVSVSLHNGRWETQPFDAIVDTGSDFCVFPHSYLEVLSLKWEDLKTASAFTHAGDFELRFAEIKASIRGVKDWNLLAGFSMQPYIPALGSIGFLDEFKVCLDHRNQYFSIESY